jgi:hypothetical protein
MPTPLPQPEKDAFIAIVNAAPYPGGPREAARLQTILVNYEDIFTAICRQLSLFVTNNAYLVEAMKVFTDADLIAVGIWNGKLTDPGGGVEPICIINSTISTTLQLTPSADKVLAIIGTSSITQVTFAASTIINDLYIGPGSELKYAVGTAGDVLIKMITLPFLRNTPSTLFAVAFGTPVNSVKVDYGSYYGGYTNIDPAVPCGTPVTGLTVGTVTHNTVPLTWTPPVSDFLFINHILPEEGSVRTGYQLQSQWVISAALQDIHSIVWLTTLCMNFAL